MISASTFACRSAVLRIIPWASPTVSTVRTTPSATPATLIAVRSGRCLTFSTPRLSMCGVAAAPLPAPGAGREHLGPPVEVDLGQVLLVRQLERLLGDLAVDRDGLRLEEHFDEVVVLNALDRDPLGPRPPVGD